MFIFPFFLKRKTVFNFLSSIDSQGNRKKVIRVIKIRVKRSQKITIPRLCLQDGRNVLIIYILGTCSVDYFCARSRLILKQ